MHAVIDIESVDALSIVNNICKLLINIIIVGIVTSIAYINIYIVVINVEVILDVTFFILLSVSIILNDKYILYSLT